MNFSQNRSCPVCSAEWQYLYKIDRFDPPFTILRCRGCGLQSQAEIAEDISYHYGEDYYSGQAAYSYQDERRNRAYQNYVWQARLKKIARFIPPPANFLDVGSAFGGFVSAAQQAGYRARGIDISAYAVGEGNKRGLHLKQTLLEQLLDDEPALKGSVDVVTLIEVFEHLPKPALAMEALQKIVRPGGLVVVQTANFLGLQARRAGANYHYYLPGHYYYYSTRNLRQFFTRFGFQRQHYYRGCDFGLWPKLMKARGDFSSWRDFRRWLKIAGYHLRSRIAWGDFAVTSSMVLYAFRDDH